VRSEGFYVDEKIPMTPAGVEPATFRFVAQHLNHCATAVPVIHVINKIRLLLLLLVVETSVHVVAYVQVSGSILKPGSGLCVCTVACIVGSNDDVTAD